MNRFHIYTCILLGLLFIANIGSHPLLAQAEPPDAQEESNALAQRPIFNFPVVPDAEISSYFDHDPASSSIIFYNGVSSMGNSGYLFSCPGVGQAWVGCATDASGEVACPNDQELWYDNHHGIDFEYSPEWHTGDTCNLDKFGDISPLIYAPAAGIVDFVGLNDLYNGNFIRLYHDLNGDGNYYNDNLRSYYLHFADNGILVDEGDIVAAGDELGYGGSTGFSWTPHLHFEVQQRTDLGWIAVDPFGWFGEGDDPWHVPSESLWRNAAED